jgi:Stage II sporulation protein M
MSANDYALAQGLRDTRATVESWQQGRWSVLGAWAALSLGIAMALLFATWVVAGMVTPDLSRISLAGVTRPIDFEDFLRILGRNTTVLAFHALACVAGFIAGASMPIAAQNRTGFSRWIHIKAGEVAILYVVAVTLFSLSVQAFILGFQAAAIAHQLQITNAVLILSVAPHALIELTAVFLPLAAWILAARKAEWNKLLAATFLTVVIAVPLLILSALLELFLWPEILKAISPVAGSA